MTTAAMIRSHSPIPLLLGALLATPLVAQDHKELGRMWTFENPPLEYFDSEYGFRPSAGVA